MSLLEVKTIRKLVETRSRQPSKSFFLNSKNGSFSRQQWQIQAGFTQWTVTLCLYQSNTHGLIKCVFKLLVKCILPHRLAKLLRLLVCNCSGSLNPLSIYLNHYYHNTRCIFLCGRNTDNNLGLRPKFTGKYYINLFAAIFNFFD